MNCSARRPCFIDHLFLTFDFCQVPRRNFLHSPNSCSQSGNSCGKSLCTLLIIHFYFGFCTLWIHAAGLPEALDSYFHFLLVLDFRCIYRHQYPWSSQSFTKERTAWVSSRSITVTNRSNSLTFSVASSLVCTSALPVITVVGLLDVLMVSNSAELRSFLLTTCIPTPGIHHKLSFHQLFCWRSQECPLLRGKVACSLVFFFVLVSVFSKIPSIASGTPLLSFSLRILQTVFASSSFEVPTDLCSMRCQQNACWIEQFCHWQSPSPPFKNSFISTVHFRVIRSIHWAVARRTHRHWWLPAVEIRGTPPSRSTSTFDGICWERTR